MQAFWKSVWQWILVVSLVAALVWRVSPATALSAESRLNRLESQVWQLRSQLRQIDAQLRRLDNPASPPTPSLDIPSPTLPSASPLADDPMFDRLATLVVEQGREIDRLKARIEALEARLERRGEAR